MKKYPCLYVLPAQNDGKEDEAMIVKIDSRRKVTFPARVLDALGVGPGDRLELDERPNGFFLRARRIRHDRLGVLRDRIPKGHPPFDLAAFRNAPRGSSLRD